MSVKNMTRQMHVMWRIRKRIRYPMKAMAIRRFFRMTHRGFVLDHPKHAVYVGSDMRLLGKTALVRDTPEWTVVAAQFDDPSLKEAFGWHRFDFMDFDMME